MIFNCENGEEESQEIVCDPRDLTGDAKASFKVLKSEIRRWQKILGLSGRHWKIGLFILHDSAMPPTSKAATDMLSTAYYICTIYVSRSSLDIRSERKRFEEMRDIACHELLHALTADFHHVATSGRKKSDELTYRYEQMVVKLSAALITLDDASRGKHDTAGSRKSCLAGADAAEEMLQLSGVPTGKPESRRGGSSRIRVRKAGR